jgi:hypothetical protein
VCGHVGAVSRAACPAATAVSPPGRGSDQSMAGLRSAGGADVVA